MFVLSCNILLYCVVSSYNIWWWSALQTYLIIYPITICLKLLIIFFFLSRLKNFSSLSARLFSSFCPYVCLLHFLCFPTVKYQSKVSQLLSTIISLLSYHISHTVIMLSQTTMIRQQTILHTIMIANQNMEAEKTVREHSSIT